MKEILVGLAANATVLAAIGWVVKEIVTHQLDKNTATFESELKAKTDLKIEEFRSELEVERIRLQISYGGIFEKQAAAIVELYRLCTKYRRDAFFAFDAAGSDNQLVTEFRESYQKLYECYERNRILIPASLDQEMRKFVYDFHLKIPQHQSLERQYSRVRSEEAFDRLWARQEELRKSIETEMPNMLEQMIGVMRELLGTEAAKRAVE